MTITDPELIKDVFNKSNDFQKPNSNPLGRLLAGGLVSHEGEKWSNYRRIINPAFNLEKLKVTFLFARNRSYVTHLHAFLKHVTKTLKLLTSHSKDAFSEAKCTAIWYLFSLQHMLLQTP